MGCAQNFFLPFETVYCCLATSPCGKRWMTSHEAACRNATSPTLAMRVHDHPVALAFAANNRAATARFESTNRCHYIRINGHNFLLILRRDPSGTPVFQNGASAYLEGVCVFIIFCSAPSPLPFPLSDTRLPQATELTPCAKSPPRSDVCSALRRPAARSRRCASSP